MRRDLPQDLLDRAQAFVDRKYNSVADLRQQALGLRYVTAERQDLAGEIASFVLAEKERA